MDTQFMQLYSDTMARSALEATISYEKERFEEKVLTLRQQIAVLDGLIERRKEVLREWALAEYQRTGKKKLSHGLGIREMSKLTYDKGEAFAWAVQHGLALALDTKAFEAIAKASKPDFVTIVTEDTVTFPTEPQKLLEK